jgi:DNA-binding Lrp family transcriptional regulator
LAVPVGKGRAGEAFGLVATLPASAAVRVVFTLARTTAEYCAALLGCLERLGGLPEAVVTDNDAGIVASRRGGVVRLVSEVAALYGALGLRPVVLRPRFPQGKGQVERSIGYLETSFLATACHPRHYSLQGRRERHEARGSVPVVTAYILIQTEVGKAAQVAKDIVAITGVQQAQAVAGPFDAIVHAEARNIDELGKLVVAREQAVDGITRTLTCPVVRL